MAGFQDFHLWEVRSVVFIAPFNFGMQEAHDDCKQISWKYNITLSARRTFYTFVSSSIIEPRLIFEECAPFKFFKNPT
jgi:hypothetical protein